MIAADQDGPTLLAEAEATLIAGDPEAARALLDKADEAGVPEPLLVRYVEALAQANRFMSRQRDTLVWIEHQLGRPHGAATHAVLLRARIEALRHLDTRRVLELADEALAAAERVGNEEAYAYVLAHAAYAATRRAEVREAARFATLAGARSFAAPRATVNALRARMFAATAAGSHEHSLDLSLEIRDRCLAMGDLEHAANECNNIAVAELTLGRPLIGLEAATRGSELAARCGFRAVETSSRALVAVAIAEKGDLDGGISLLRRAVGDGNGVVTTDVDAALGYWLLERDAPGDPAEAAQAAERAVASARSAGIRHYLTMLLCTLARARSRLGDPRGSRDMLEQARSAADTADAVSERHLVVAMAELLPPGDPARRTALNAARARLLREAGNRDDPLAYCTGVRLHRRLLELTGGVPLDLPRAR